MFSPKYLDFHFPLFTTCLHMLVQFCLASIVLYFIPRLRPRPDSISNPLNHFHVRQDNLQAEKPLMTRMFYLTRVSPCGAATGLDIGLGNMSLKFITLTFYSKSSLSQPPLDTDTSGYSNVQILFFSLRPLLRLPLPPRDPIDQTHHYHRYNDTGCHHDGGWRDCL